MVAPRDIPVVIVLEHVHDLVRTGTTVIDVTENMKLVDGEALDDICNSDDDASARPVLMIVSMMTLT